jgi:phosphatidylserine decarboxylase
MDETDGIIEELRKTLGEDNLSARLEQSLRQARKRAEAELKKDLFDVLDWPETIAEYEGFLRQFVRWVPHESGEAVWQEDGQSQELDDRQSQFFFLVDQPVDGGAPQDSLRFRDWLSTFSTEWGKFLDSPESFGPQILQSFLDHAPQYRLNESMVGEKPNNPSGWLTFNQFIARQLNGGLRPIAEPDDNGVVTSPADCEYQQTFDIDGDSNIPATSVKNEKFGNIKQLLGDSKYSSSFAGGTFVHYELVLHSYHRYHLPVGGLVKEAYRIDGKPFMRVGLEDQAFAGSDSATSGYEFSQTRGVVVIDTADGADQNIGLVAIVPVGMAHVSSVVLTASEGKHMSKGEEFGYFQFGGSDLIILFQEGVKPQIDKSEGMRFVGQAIARCL